LSFVNPGVTKDNNAASGLTKDNHEAHFPGYLTIKLTSFIEIC